MATVSAEDLHSCVWEGEEEFRPDRTVCGDKSLSLNIFPSGWIYSRTKRVFCCTTASSSKKAKDEQQQKKKLIQTHMQSYVCTEESITSRQIQLWISALLHQNKHSLLGAAGCLSSLSESCLRAQQVFSWYTRYRSHATLSLANALQQKKGRSAEDKAVCTRSWAEFATAQAFRLPFVRSLVSTVHLQLHCTAMCPLLCNYGAPQTHLKCTSPAA